MFRLPWREWFGAQAQRRKTIRRGADLRDEPTDVASAAPRFFEALEERVLLSLPPTWTSVGPGGGGAFFSPVFSTTNANELYAATDMSDLYHSTDLGASWTVIDFRTLQGTSSNSIQFTNDANVRYGVNPDGNVVKTVNGGTTWPLLGGSPTSYSTERLLADPNDKTRLIVSDYNNICFSSNGGTSFTVKYTDNSGSGAYVAGAFFDGSNIYIGTNKGFLVSSNGGASFAMSTATGIPGTEAIVSFAGAKVGGTTRFFAVTLGSGDVYPGVTGADHGNYVAVYSIDVGQASWTKRVTGIAATDHPFFVGMALNDINTAYLSGGSDNGAPAVYKTTNGGANWTSVFKTTTNQNIQTGWQGSGGDRDWGFGEFAEGFAVAPFDASKVIITDEGGAHLTSDGGANWHAVYVNPADLNVANHNITTGKVYRGNGLDDTSVWWLTWADANNLFADYTDIKGVRSTDGGLSWSFNYSGDSYNSMYQTSVAANGTLYAAVSSVHDIYQWRLYLTDGKIDGGTGAVLMSTNKGATWTTLHNFAKPVIWTALDPNNANTMYAAVVNHAGSGTAGGIYVSTNINLGAASTWTLLAAPPRTEGHPFNIVVLNDGTLVATYSARLATTSESSITASSGVFVSTNGGTSWIDRSAAAMQYYTRDITIDPTDATQNTWYVAVWNGASSAAGKGGLYKTVDRGQHWALVPGTDGIGSVTQLAINPANTDEAYITSEGNGLWYTSNIHTATPVLTAVAEYPFGTPTRVFFNPYNAAQVWVTSYGNSLRYGVEGVSDTTPPTVAIAAVAPDPRNSAVGSVTIVFSEAVTGFNLPDLGLTRNAAPVALAGATVNSGDNITWTLGNLTGLTGAAGSYVLTLSAAGSGIADLASNPLAAGASDSWTTDLTAPTVGITPVAPDPRNNAVGSVSLTFSEAIAGFDLADLHLTRDGAAVALTTASLSSGDNIHWTLGNLSGLTGTTGSYILTLTAAASGITDGAANALTSGASDGWTTDATPPTVTIMPCTLDARSVAVDTVSIVFSEVVTGFDLADLSLTRNAAAAPLTGATLTTSDNITFTLGNLAPLTVNAGTYLLTLTAAASGIADQRANAIVNGAGNTWTVDTAAAEACRADFNGDGISDVLWRYTGGGTSQGANQVWLMNASGQRQSYVTLPSIGSLDWQIADAGDFNGDGVSDVLWRYYGPGAAQGANMVWLMDNTGHRASIVNLPAVASLEWRVQGVGDFNGDGRDDVLWRYYGAGGSQGSNMVWLMNASGNRGSTVNLPMIASLDWRVQGVGDFNGDGKCDVLWRYFGTGASQGANQVWLFNNSGQRQSTVTLPSISNLNWKVSGVGDFNGDGTADVVWRYVGAGVSQGANQVWLLNTSAQRQGAVSLPAITSLSWKVVGVGDYNNDGVDDLMWRYFGAGGSQGADQFWLFNHSGQRQSIVTLPAIGSLGWVVASHRPLL